MRPIDFFSRIPALFILLGIALALGGCGGGEVIDDDGDTPPSTGTPPPGSTQCSDGVDNDGDGGIDHASVTPPGQTPDNDCDSPGDDNETADVAPPPPPPGTATFNRYEFSSFIRPEEAPSTVRCWALRSNGNGNFVALNGGAYTASEATTATAEAFYMKASSLGNYLLYNTNRQVLSTDGGATITNVNSASASTNSEWRVIGVGDGTNYPATPPYHVEPSAAYVDEYHNFVDPNREYFEFTLTTTGSNGRLATDGSGNLVSVAPGSDPANESFSFEPLASGCLAFPEANSNFTGVPFSGSIGPERRVLGHTDAHIHISATEFLGGAEWGRPYHRFGIEHALPDCSPRHGPTGQQDLVGGLFTNDPDGHATDGYPTFTEWPARDNLTHDALYWRWLERAWAGGLRVIVNDLVDNETLCELQRNAVGEPQQDCNPMNNAGRQAGTMYAMQDYIDAQYGGRGEGFFQIVHTPTEARDVIEDGKAAVVLGIEISNLFDCQLTYNPLRMTEPFQEPAGGLSPTENRYACTMEEGQPNSILTQMERTWNWGVRQIISIHEFDNAFGGNGIFDGMILNLGNRENSGGNPTPGGDFFDDPFAFNPPNETPTGEFWTTYNCPIENDGGANDPPDFSGYLWGSSGGSSQSFLSPPLCFPTGQGGRSGGTTPCYPSGVRQCNARWMTPVGLYTYKKMMEFGFLIDWDHMEMGMKTQLLELFEAQTPPYPVVSTHGTFGGTTVEQATRALQIGSYLYPSNGSSRGFRNDMNETLGLHAAGSVPFLFGFGYGTDTNGLSGQSGPRGSIDPGDEIGYPFSFYTGGRFTGPEGDPQLAADLAAIGAGVVTFDQPNSTNVDGIVGRTWHQDVEGTSHGGMVTDWIQEINIEGSPEQMRHLFNSAEVFIQTWERTEASSANLPDDGPIEPVDPILRAAPPVNPPAR